MPGPMGDAGGGGRNGGTSTLPQPAAGRQSPGRGAPALGPQPSMQRPGATGAPALSAAPSYSQRTLQQQSSVGASAAPLPTGPPEQKHPLLRTPSMMNRLPPQAGPAGPAPQGVGMAAPPASGGSRPAWKGLSEQNGGQSGAGGAGGGERRVLTPIEAHEGRCGADGWGLGLCVVLPALARSTTVPVQVTHDGLCVLGRATANCNCQTRLALVVMTPDAGWGWDEFDHAPY